MSIDLTPLYKAVVCHFGGQLKTVKALKAENNDTFSQSSVSEWVTGKSKMRPRTAATIQFLTKGKFKAIDLCPELKECLALLKVSDIDSDPI